MYTRSGISLITFILVLAIGTAVQAAPTLDLTTAGSYGQINGALFYQADPRPTGTGYIRSFVRIQDQPGTEEGYNTDGRPLQFDENTSAEFTRSLRLADVPVVNTGGIDYREFLLDINESNGGDKNFLSLDKLEIYLGHAPNLLGYPTGLGAKVYDLDEGGDNWILLDYDLNSGSGSGDMFAYIPDSSFTGGDYVYLYSRFGDNATCSAGFEEWAVREAEPIIRTVPAPGAMLLVALGTISLGYLRRRGGLL